MQPLLALVTGASLLLFGASPGRSFAATANKPKLTTRKSAGTKTTSRSSATATTVKRAPAPRTLDAATVAAARGEPIARSPAKGEPYRFGLLLAAAGNDGVVEETAAEVRRGADLAVGFLNELGGIAGRPIGLAIADEGATNESAVRAMNALLEKNQIYAVIGPTLSSRVRDVSAVAAQSKVLLFGATTSANGVAALTPWARRVALSPDVVADATIKALVANRPVSSAVVLAPAGKTAATVQASSFAKAFQAHGVSRKLEQLRVGESPEDVQRAIGEVISALPDAVVVTGPSADALRVISELRTQVVRSLIVLDPSLLTVEFLDRCKELCDSTLAPILYDAQDPSTLARAALLRRYFDAHGRQPSLAAAQGFASVQILAIALDAVVNDRNVASTLLAQRSALRTRVVAGEYDTPIGIIRYGPDGEPKIDRLALGEINRSGDVARIRVLPVNVETAVPGVPDTQA